MASSLYDSYRPRSIHAKPPTLAATAAAPTSPPMRAEGRTKAALRPLYMRTGVVHGCAGSAYLECGRTKVLASVFGPRWSKRHSAFTESGQLYVDVKFAPSASVERKKRGQSIEERALSLTITDALLSSLTLHHYPKSAIEVYLLVIEDDGGVLELSVSGASLALADAAIAMTSLIAATSVTRFTDTVTHLDCDTAERRHCATGSATLSVAYRQTDEQLTHVSQHGRISEDAYHSMLDLAITGCQQILALMRECLKQSALKKLQQQRAVAQSNGSAPMSLAQ